MHKERMKRSVTQHMRFSGESKAGYHEGWKMASESTEKRFTWGFMVVVG